MIDEIKLIKEFADKAAKIQMISSQMSNDKDNMVSVTDDFLSTDGHNQMVNFFNRYKLAAAKVASDIPGFISALKMEEQDYTSKWWDIFEDALKVWRFFSPSEVEDATQQLSALKVSLEKVSEYADAKLAIMDKLSEHKDNLKQIGDLLTNENMTVDQLQQMAKEQGGKENPTPKAPTNLSAVPELPTLGK